MPGSDCAVTKPAQSRELPHLPSQGSAQQAATSFLLSWPSPSPPSQCRAGMDRTLQPLAGSLPLAYGSSTSAQSPLLKVRTCIQGGGSAVMGSLHPLFIPGSPRCCSSQESPPHDSAPPSQMNKGLLSQIALRGPPWPRFKGTGVIPGSSALGRQGCHWAAGTSGPFCPPAWG